MDNKKIINNILLSIFIAFYAIQAVYSKEFALIGTLERAKQEKKEKKKKRTSWKNKELNTQNPSYKFPKDHFAHKGYEIEWWYYTGHFRVESLAKDYGYELTFFKIELGKAYKAGEPKGEPKGEFKGELKGEFKGAFKAKPIYMSHFAISDKTDKKYYYKEKLTRPIGGISGASTDRYEVWNGLWRVDLNELGKHILKAQMNEGGKSYKIELKLEAKKKPVIHGKGLSFKGEEKDNYSYYYSIPRLSTRGYIYIDDKRHKLEGISWFDHEWMNNRKYFVAKWDWFSIQLKNGTDIMFYKIKDENNVVQEVSQGTLSDKEQKKTHLSLSDTKIKELRYWESKKTGARYPVAWNLDIKKDEVEINLDIKPYFHSQEFVPQSGQGVIYWEGAVRVEGLIDGEAVDGVGYVELVGYARKARKARKGNKLLKTR